MLMRSFIGIINALNLDIASAHVHNMKKRIVVFNTQRIIIHL